MTTDKDETKAVDSRELDAALAVDIVETDAGKALMKLGGLAIALRYGKCTIKNHMALVEEIMRLQNPILDLIKSNLLASRTDMKADKCTCPQHGTWLAADDYYRNVKALDEALNGVPAERPLLIDILAQVQGIVRQHGKPLLEIIKNI